jgi:L-rhamnonate dehydratase
VIPHGGGARDSVHFIMATPNSPWAELFMPAPGGPKEAYQYYEEENLITRGRNLHTALQQTGFR